MQSRERIINSLIGQKIDRRAFCPFLSYWWESQSDDFTNLGELEFIESIGADPMFRGHYPMHGKNYEDLVLFNRVYGNCNVLTCIEGNEKIVRYQTPIGDLKACYKYVDGSKTWFLVNHPVENEKDFTLLKYLMDDTFLVADYARYEKEASCLGSRGLLIPVICPELKSSFQSLLEHWVGTENLVYFLIDFPDIVDSTLKSMFKVSEQAAIIAADSSALIFLSWEDTSTTNISPDYYERYILPEVNMWCSILHKKNKLYMQHACGHLNDLLKYIAASDIDVIESISPPPTGNISLDDVKNILPANIAIVGGIEPVKLLESSNQEIYETGIDILELMKDRKYILANSDSCPPGTEIDKFKILVQATREK